MSTRKVQCECGDWSGVPCQWHGPQAETVIIEYMPEWLRASHKAANHHTLRSSGVYPLNGAVRLWVNRLCAQRMVAYDGEWIAIVSS